MESLARDLTAGAAWGPVAFGIAFLGGLVAGLGPCVLPMIPAVFGYVTGQVGESEGRSPLVRGLALSAVFVLGMSLVFAAIGAIAGLIGTRLDRGGVGLLRCGDGLRGDRLADVGRHQPAR